MDTLPYKNKWFSLHKTIQKIYKSLSPERVIFLWFFFILSCFFFLSSFVIYNKQFLITVPTYGGSLSEGIIGTPRFINPVLSTSDQDNDLTSLVFAGLTKKNKDGQNILDMAENIAESEDKLRYDVTLRKDAFFHDGEKVTSDDIIYTINLIQTPSLKSPHRIEWEGITIEKTNETQFSFTLKKPFPLFMDTLNIGILPKHLWKNLNEDQISLSDYNIHAVGSGPYKITKVTTDSGIPTTFQMASHKKYTLGKPYIDTLTLYTYQNEKYLLKALEDREITRIHGIAPNKIKSLGITKESIKTSLLPRTFTLFFNPNKAESLSDKNVRQALQMAINKEKIVTEVLYQYGKVINDPYPFDEEPSETSYNENQARDILKKSKVLKKASSTLQITLATANTEEMKKVAEMVKSDWEKIGISVTLAVYEVSDLNQSVIKDRDFQVLLFGTITETPSDLYAFWHSSQRNYPGLNISNYVSKKLDTNLELLRNSNDEEERNEAYQNVKKEFQEEIPGIFLFAPSLIYVTNDTIQSSLPSHGVDNASRFTLIENWYEYEDHVLPKTYNKRLLTLLENIIH